MTKKQKKILIRIIITIILTIALQFIPLKGVPRLFAYLIVYAIIGYDIVRKAFKGIVNGRVFDENFLMIVATLGAFFLGAWTGSGDYLEAVAVMLFYQIGELFQSYAVGRSRKNIAALMDIRPDYANIEVDGSLEQVDPDEVEIGTTIVVQPGEKVPIDGIVTKGSSSLDTIALTGESLPKDVGPGEEIFSGSINMNAVLWVRTTKLFGESTASKILDLVENASSNKSRTENFISRFAAVYTPIVCVAALLLAVGVPIVRLILGLDGDWETWVYRGLTFLVVSCPCAFVISIPLSFFAGLGCAGKEGILIKGSNYLEILSKTECMVFDKTGTLTKGRFEVTDVYSNEIEMIVKESTLQDGKIVTRTIKIDEEKLIEIAALSECASTHPISKSLQQAYGRAIDRNRVSGIREISGQGIQAVVDGTPTAIGNHKLMDTLGIKYETSNQAGTISYVAVDGKYAGYIVIADAVKESSAAAIAELKKNGVKKTVMLTGDVKTVADKVGSSLGIDEIHAGLMPGQKVEIVERLLADMTGNQPGGQPISQSGSQPGSQPAAQANNQLTIQTDNNTFSKVGDKNDNPAAGPANKIRMPRSKGKLAFAGDGINDAPVLARADIGIAMGALGSDAAIEAADVVLMDDDPMQIVKAIKISRKCIGIVYQNIVFSLVVKIGCLVLTACGITNMWAAIFADVGVMVLAVLNSIRALKYKG